MRKPRMSPFVVSVLFLICGISLAKSHPNAQKTGDSEARGQAAKVSKLCNFNAGKGENPDKGDPNCKKVSIVESPNSPTYFNIAKNSAFKQPPYPAGDWGNLLEVHLSAPGKIYQVDFHCDGEACGWVHECPDGGKCGAVYVYRVVYNADGSALWYGWSNSGNYKAVLEFTIHFE